MIQNALRTYDTQKYINKHGKAIITNGPNETILINSTDIFISVG